jgi:hypothetical protein
MTLTKTLHGFSRQLTSFSRVSMVLLSDLESSLVLLRDASDMEPVAASYDSASLNYSLKRSIRCLLGWVEGTAAFLRATVLECGPQMKLPLTPAERKKLRKPGGGPRGGLRTGYDSFAKLIGSDLRIDCNSRAWNAFSELVDIRNDFTHPEDIGDLIASRGAHLLVPVMLWFGQLSMEIVGEANCRLLAHAPTNYDQMGVPSVASDASARKLGEIFGQKFYEQLGDSALISIRYLRLCLGILGNETVRAMKEIPADQGFHSVEVQFAYRNLIRTLSSEVEGITHFLTCMLELGARRDEFVVTSDDRNSMTLGNVEEKLVATASVWSREVGDGKIPRTINSSFTALGEVRGIRNRLTHPRREEDLEIDTKRASVILAAVGWFAEELLPAISITDKWQPKHRT